MGRSTIVTVNALEPPTKIGTSLSINVSPTSGAVPLQVSVWGRLGDISGTPLNGKSIKLYSNGVLIGSTTTSAGGAGSPGGDYTFSVNIALAGQYQFQTEFPGDDVYEGCSVHNGTHALGEAQLPWLAIVAAVGVGAGLYFLLKH